MKRGTKPDIEKDMEVVRIREDTSLSKRERTFRAIAKKLNEDLKNVYDRYKRAGGKVKRLH